MMGYSPAPRYDIVGPTITPNSKEMFGSQHIAAYSSGTWGTTSIAIYLPMYLIEPFLVSKSFWCNGATVGTNSIDLGVYQMTDRDTGRMDLIRSTGAVLSAGSANVVQEVGTWKVAANSAALTAAGSATDATSYTTASVTLKAGRLYLMSVNNSKASAADVISSITGGGTWSSRSSVAWNTSTANRVSIWSCVPVIDYTGTIVIDFGANTETGAVWSLNEFSGVDTATNDGIVQQATGSGTSVTPLATLAAFGSANNATFGALANTTDTTTTPGTGFTELSDTTAATPTKCLQTEWRVDNDTTVDGTITSLPWGACAVEIKADASAFIIPASDPLNPDIYMGMSINGTTATVFRFSFAAITANDRQRQIGMLTSNGARFPLATVQAAPISQNLVLPLAGFSRRSLIG